MQSASARARPSSRGAVEGFGRPALVVELVAALGDLVQLYVDPDGIYESMTERALLDRAAAVLDRAKRRAPRP